MAHSRRICALALCLSLSGSPVWSATPVLGTVTSAKGAHLGTAAASAGATVFGGDQLSTEPIGAIQVRTAAARFQLFPSSTAVFGEDSGIPTATLLGGTAVFSTANSQAFVLRASIAEIRAQSNAPTVAQVSVISPKELLVRGTRGALAITVDGETKIIPEASAYRVLLDPEASPPDAAQGPSGAGTNGPGRGPLKAGRSRFILIATIVTAAATGVALFEALQSPDRP